MTKSDTIWSGYWALRCELGSGIAIWLRSLAQGSFEDVAYWQDYIIERAEAAMILHAEFRRLNRPPKRRRKAA